MKGLEVSIQLITSRKIFRYDYGCVVKYDTNAVRLIVHSCGVYKANPHAIYFYLTNLTQSLLVLRKFHIPNLYNS
jgi:hypothetical protein